MLAVIQLLPIFLSLKLQVKDKHESSLWNGLIDHYHYLGYQPLVGAQARYLIESDAGILGCIGFGESAWKIAPRDQWIGRDKRYSIVLDEL